jgi:hypothetical protein
MQMSEFVRREDLEGAVQDNYGVSLGVYYRPLNRNEYEIKLVNGSAECTLHETMDKGRTSHVVLTKPDNTNQVFKVYRPAEELAVELLRS